MAVSLTVLIVQNDSINLNYISNPVSCYGLSDGIIEINHISGGTHYLNIRIIIVFLSSSNIFNNLSPGLTNIIVRDNDAKLNLRFY